MHAYIRIGCSVIQSNVRREGVLNANVGHEEETSTKNENETRKEKISILRQLKTAKSSFLIAL